jgi:hypothetical protein
MTERRLWRHSLAYMHDVPLHPPPLLLPPPRLARSQARTVMHSLVAVQ